MTRDASTLCARLCLLVLAVALLLAAGALCLAAPAARATNSAAAEARAVRGLSSDWGHICEVADWLRYRKPPRRVVYVLGGSAGREAVTTEAAWSRDLSRRCGGRPAAGYDLSSKTQTLVEDLRIIKALPSGRGVAVILVGLTRFYSVRLPKSISTTAVRTTPPRPWYQHHYETRLPLPLARKRELVANWRTLHLVGFTTYYPQTLKDLDAVVRACVDRGIRPVLVEMPENLVALQHDLDDVRATYQEGCRELAAERGIPYIDFNASLGLRSRDFYDLWHLLGEGRAKWQARLSRQLVARGLLR